MAQLCYCYPKDTRLLCACSTFNTKGVVLAWQRVVFRMEMPQQAGCAGHSQVPLCVCVEVCKGSP